MGVMNLNRVLEQKGQRNPGTRNQDFPDVGVVEVDVGPKPVAEFVCTVYDDRVTSSNHILAQACYQAATGKDLDECEMDQLYVQAGNAGTGWFQIHLRSVDGSYLEGGFVLSYNIINSGAETFVADDMLIEDGEVVETPSS